MAWTGRRPSRSNRKASNEPISVLTIKPGTPSGRDSMSALALMSRRECATTTSGQVLSKVVSHCQSLGLERRTFQASRLVTTRLSGFEIDPPVTGPAGRASAHKGGRRPVPSPIPTERDSSDAGYDMPIQSAEQKNPESQKQMQQLTLFWQLSHSLANKGFSGEEFGAFGSAGVGSFDWAAELTCRVEETHEVPTGARRESACAPAAA